MLVSEAHLALSSFSKRNAGIGISIELIRRLIFDQLKRLTSRFESLESNQTFKNSYKVFFSGEFDTSSLTFNFGNVVNPVNANEFFPQVQINNLILNIKGQIEVEEGGIMVKKTLVLITVEYPVIAGIIQLIDKKLKITLFNERHTESGFVKQWEIDQSLKTFFESAPHNFTNSDWDELVIYFKATSLFSGRDIADSFINSLNLPDIFKIFNGVKFGDNSKIGADASGNLLMFTADTTLNFLQCPTYNATGQTRVESVAKVDGNPGTYAIGETPTNGGEISVETNVSEGSPSSSYPVKHNTEKISTGDVFLFTPIELLKVNFDIVKPSVTASDSNNFGPIYWRYSVTAAVKSIALNLIRNWPIEFRLSTPTEVTGQAGAGVKIGCIRYEAAGAMFDGEVEPFDINFKIDLDWDSMQIIFVSRIENIKGKNFSFRTFPKLDFPVSEIIDFILGRAAEFVITEQADKILNVTRIPIANLNILNRFAKIRQKYLAGETDVDGNVTIGVELLQTPS